MYLILKKINSPVVFQGHLQMENYFEGWYYKQSSSDGKTIISFIPGISLFKGDHHAFVQYILVTIDKDDNHTTKTGYIRYKLANIRFQNEPFAFMIGENSFSQTGLTINLSNQNFSIRGEFRLGPLTPLNRSLYIPNIMGPFAYVPWMECYHGIISMNHSLRGNLIIDGQPFDFNSGKGYIEKDWGTSFPQEYVWIQSNYFQNPNTSLFLSVAHIPFMRSSFRGFICNLVVRGQEYRFATYNKSTLLTHKISPEEVCITLHSNKAVLKINAFNKITGDLIAPISGCMNRMIKEGHSGEVYIELVEKRTNTIYKDVGKLAGIEVVGYN